ncbi:MAG: hypothetical protein U0234_21310 [Sandaracinus sp.]
MPTASRALALVFVLFCLVPLGASSVRAQARGDASVVALGAELVGRESQAGAAPYALHPSGDLVFAADGILRTDARGTTRWAYADASIVDAAVSGDGAVTGLARLPVARPTTARLVRFDDTGHVLWTRELHRGALDAFTYPDLTGAPGGDVVLCATLRGPHGGVVVDRVDAAGHVRWSQRLDASAECTAVVTDAAGVVWAGMTNGGTTGIVERLDASGHSRWRALFDGPTIPIDLALAPDGSVLVGGELDGAADLLPGAREQRVEARGYTAFVTRLAPDGSGAWAWLGDSIVLRSVLARGSEVLVVQQGRFVRLDALGVARETRSFGVPSVDGAVSQPFLSVTGALLDAHGDVVLALGVPTPDAVGLARYTLFGEAPYEGPRGSVLARPGW